MKKKILSFALCLVAVLGFVITPFASYATDISNSDTLIEEMQTNIPDFDPSSYSFDSDGDLTIIGSTIFDERTGGLNNILLDTVFSVYVYNPTGVDLNYAVVRFVGNDFYYDAGKSFDLMHHDSPLMFYKENCSKDNLFYKFSCKLDVPEQFEGSRELRFSIDSLSVYAGNNVITLDQTFNSSFVSQGDGTYSVKYYSFGAKDLEVNLTSYRIGTVDADITKRYEVFTSYFAIPDSYISSYENLYSLTSSYTKKETYPILWSEDPLTYSYFAPFVFNGETLYNTNTSFVSSNYVYDKHLYGYTFISNSTINVYSAAYGANVSEVVTHPWVGKNILGIVSDKDPSYNEVVEFLDQYHKDDPDKLIYSTKQDIVSKTTVDQSFDILNYYGSASYVNYYQNYGADIALIRWIYDNPDYCSNILGFDIAAGIVGFLPRETIRDLCDLIGIDFEAAGEHLTDLPYIVLLSDEDRNFIRYGSDENVSKKYLIDVKDVPTFRTYVELNPYTVLYRYDVSTFYSDELIQVNIDRSNLFGESADIEGVERVNNYTYNICKRFDFDDYQVINVTFKDENEYISVCTRSERKNFAPGFTVDIYNSPVFQHNGFSDFSFDNVIQNIDKGVNDLFGQLGIYAGAFLEKISEYLGSFGGFFDGFFDNLLGDWSQYIKPVLIVIGVILLILFFVWVGRSVGDSNFFSVYFQAKGASQRSKELKLRRSEAKARREEHRDDVSIRREQNAIRKREATIKELDNKARNENTAKANAIKELDSKARNENASKANAIKERDQQRRIAREEAAEKARQKEERRKAREAKKAEKEKAERDKKAQAKYNNYSTADALDAAIHRTYDDKK